jgi:beta-lactamase regulating signal transducer with metallopeptidase domain
VIAAAMVYAIAVTLLLGLAALAVDRLLALRRMPRRGVWATVLAASFLIPSVMLASASLRTHPVSAEPTKASFPATGAGEVTDAKSGDAPSAHATLQWPVRPRLDPLLVALWALSSATVLLCLTRASLRFKSIARTWRRRSLGNASVLITDEVGPAVLGVTKPRIVIPRWLLEAPAAMRSMVFRHEREHIAAGDPLVLRAALLLLSLAPWNLPLWWLLRRLRLAIEIDCDARVLKGGADLRTYGESLLLVSQHRPRTPLAGTALTETVSQLERRIHFMISETPRHSIALLGALAGSALLLCASAAALDPPSPVTATELQKSVPGSDNRLASNLAALVEERYPDLLSRKAAGTPVVSVLFKPDGSVERTSYTMFEGSPVNFKPTKDHYAKQLNIPSSDVSYVGLQGIVFPTTGQTILVAFTERGRSGAPSTSVIGTPNTREIDRSLTERYFPDVLAGTVDAGMRLWILFDSEGHVLRNGREPRGDEPIGHVLQARFPGIETEYVTSTFITDRTARLIRDRAGEPLGLLCVWLKKGSPLPGKSEG